MTCNCFVTSNHRDFSAPNGDHRQPHFDLTDIFSSPQSRYLYQVEGLHAGLLDYFGDEFAEEYEEVEFLIGEEEPRMLAEIVDAMEEFFDRKHSDPHARCGLSVVLAGGGRRFAY